MTKKKIIEDIIKHSPTSRDKDTLKLIPQFYCGQNWIINAHSIYKDAKMPPLEFESSMSESSISTAEGFFTDSKLRELSSAIEIDTSVLKAWIKEHRRNDCVKRPFIIGLKKGEYIRYICINGWYLRNQLEYLKDNRIFIEPDRFRPCGDNAKVYVGVVYSFSDDFNTTMCATNPVFWNGEFKADYMIKERG